MTDEINNLSEIDLINWDRLKEGDFLRLEWSVEGEILKYIPSKSGRNERRIELFRQQDGLCHWCSKRMSLQRTRASTEGRVKDNDWFASFEHKQRRYDGGKFTIDNIALAHAGCNRKREKGLPPNGPKWRHLLINQAMEKSRREAAARQVPK